MQNHFHRLAQPRRVFKKHFYSISTYLFIRPASQVNDAHGLAVKKRRNVPNARANATSARQAHHI
jgi:hypothetical protein